MTTMISAPPPSRARPGGRITLSNMPWDAYEAVLELAGERPFRVNYSDGELEIMTLSAEHEAAKKRLAMLIEGLAFVLRMPIAARGSTTFKDERLGSGAEPDECYYIANERKIRRRKRIDLRRDPPPDLVVEIDITYQEIDREQIYARMRVPELWRYDGRRLSFAKLAGGEWSPIEKSLSFPHMRPADLVRFLRMAPRSDDTSIRWAFHDWLGKQEWVRRA